MITTMKFDRIHNGYVVVFACFVILLVVYGIHYTFGLYLKPILAEFGWSRAVTSGAYSLSWLLQGPSSVFMGRLNDKYGPRLVLSLCGVLLFAGIIMTTRITAGWHLYLSYGVIIGIGTGGAYVPIVSTIARRFTEKRAMMTGIAISGMGFGTFLLSPVANFLISHYSWQTSYTVLGVSLLCVTLVVAQFLRFNDGHPIFDTNTAMAAAAANDSEKKSFAGKSNTLRKALSQVKFWKVFGMFFCFGYSLMAVMVHIAAHAVDIGKTTAMAAGLVSAIGISSIAGKIAFGYSGDRIGSRKIYMICFAITSVSLLVPIFFNSMILLFLFAIIFGLSYGGKACSQSPLTAEMFGLNSHGAIMGTLNIGFTTGATVGPFFTGFLFDVRGDYRIAFLIAGLFSLLGLGLAVVLKRNADRIIA